MLSGEKNLPLPCYCPVSLLTFTTQLGRLLLVSLLFDFICPWLIIQRWNPKGRASRPLSANRLSPTPTARPRLIALVYFSRRVLAVYMYLTNSRRGADRSALAQNFLEVHLLSLAPHQLLPYPAVLPFSHHGSCSLSGPGNSSLVPSPLLPPLYDQVPPAQTVQSWQSLLLQSLLFVPLTLPSLDLICHLAKPLQLPPGCPLTRSGVDISSCP